MSRSRAEREGDRQRHRAVGCRLREHVEHALDAVDLLLERRGHGLGDDLRVGAGIRRADDDRRRHDARVFADRQPEQRQRRPATTISSDSTAAKIGRSMKNLESFIQFLTSRGATFLRRTFCARVPAGGRVGPLACRSMATITGSTFTPGAPAAGR